MKHKVPCIQSCIREPGAAVGDAAFKPATSGRIVHAIGQNNFLTGLKSTSLVIIGRVWGKQTAPRSLRAIEGEAGRSGGRFREGARAWVRHRRLQVAWLT